MGERLGIRGTANIHRAAAVLWNRTPDGVPEESDSFLYRFSSAWSRSARTTGFGGTQNDWVLRLARRGAVRFSDSAVHERMILEGREGRLRATMDHVKYRSLTEHVLTIEHYTTLVARDRHAAGVRFSMFHLLRIPGEIWTRLILKGGILDGPVGVIHAAMSAFYTFLKYAKLADPTMDRRGGDERAP